MGKTPGETTLEFSREMHACFIGNKNAPTVKQVSYEMGKGYSPIEIYKILEGERAIEIGEFPRFYQFCETLFPALQWFVRKCDPKLEIVKITSESTDGRIEDELEQMIVRLGDLTAENIKARKDGHYSEIEICKLRSLAAGLCDEVNQLMAEIAKMEVKI